MSACIRTLLLVLGTGLLLPSCLRTRIEVSTQVASDGSLERTVSIQSEDAGKPAPLPEGLLPPGAGYGLLEDVPGRLRAAGSFSDPGHVPPAFGFHVEALQRDSTESLSLSKQDWGLFTIYRYQEMIHDIVDRDQALAALQEVSDRLLELSDTALASLLGDSYSQSAFHRQLRGRNTEFAHRLAFVLWQELLAGHPDRDPKRIERRVASTCAAYGLKIQPEWFEQDPESPGSPLRRAVADWLRPQLETPAPAQGRSPILPDLDALLFGGPFEQALRAAAERSFGGPEGVEAWMDRSRARVFGIFGAVPLQVFSDRMDFTLKVHLPGTLLRSNGFLGDRGWTFVQFPKEDIYPDGAGLRCSSVEWDYGAVGAFPQAAITPGNENAIAWTWVIGEGPDSTPDPALVAALHRSVHAMDLQALRDYATSEGLDKDARARARHALDWLQGKRD